MRKTYQIALFVFLIIIGDRYFFLSSRLDNLWEYESGYYIGDPIGLNPNIQVLDNFNLKISKNGVSASYYLIGCYFGNLLLLEKENLKFTRYITR